MDLKNIFIFFLCCISQAQDYRITFNKSNWSVFNPAYTGVEGSLVSLNTRSQWINIEGAPRTSFLMYHLPKRKNVNLGLSIKNDKIFIENKTFINVDYNYQLQLDESRFLFLGIKAGGFYNNIDLTALPRIFNEYNPALSTVSSYFTPILGFGIHYKAPKYFVGVSIPSIFSNKRFENNTDWETSATDRSFLHLTGGSDIKINDSFNLNSALTFNVFSKNPNLFIANISMLYKDQFSIGTGFSNNKSIAVYTTFYSKKGFQWGYGYEFINGLKADAIKSSTHEIMIRINLEKIKKEKTEKDEKN